MSSRQVKAAAYKAAESRPGASGRGSRDASKKSASLARLAGPPLTNQRNTPNNNSVIRGKKNIIYCNPVDIFLLIAANKFRLDEK